jgi:hypothetical protein
VNAFAPLGSRRGLHAEPVTSILRRLRGV